MALLAWVFASPAGSAPDDDLHIANIYCISDASTCRSDDWVWPSNPPYWPPDSQDRTGPEYAGAKIVYRDIWRYQQPRGLPCFVTNGSTWYSPDPAVPATCLETEDRANNQPASLDLLDYYPNVYYRVMSVLTQDTIRQSVVVWRLVNVLIAIVALTASVLLSAPRYRRPIVLAALSASVPLGLFLVSSINPSSWLLLGTAAFLGPALTFLRERGSPGLLTARIAFMLTCLLMMVAGRSEGIGHAVVLALVTLLLGLKAPRGVYVLLASTLALGGLGALVVISRSDAPKTQAALDWIRGGTTGPGLWDAVLATPGWFFASDAFRLGWLDVVPPPAAVIATQAAFWSAAALGLAVFFWRKGLALLITGGALLLGPAVLAVGGWPSPPTRYFLPLVYMLAFVFLVPDWGKWLPRWSSAQWIALGAALSIANSLSLLYLTVRYVSGIQPGTTNPRSLSAAGTPDWWWGAWLSPFWNWALGTVAFAVAVGLLFTLPSIREGAEDHPDEDEPEKPEPYHDFWNPPEDPEVQVPAAR